MMRVLGAACAALLALLGLAGCGEAPEVSAGAASWRSCDLQAFAGAGGRLARLSLEGQDQPVVVKLVTGGGPCGGGLVARYDDGVAGRDVSGLDLDPASAQVVTLADGQSLLRVDGAGHPRGGFQPHLFSLGADLAEVRVDGAPLLPFVATDGGAAPTMARCGADGTVQLLRATTSKPPGVVLAWDVHRTTYEINGAEAVRVAAAQTRDHVADPLLHEQMPGLFEPGGLLDNCSG